MSHHGGLAIAFLSIVGLLAFIKGSPHDQDTAIYHDCKLVTDQSLVQDKPIGRLYSCAEGDVVITPH